MTDLPRYKLAVGDRLRYVMACEPRVGEEEGRDAGRTGFSLDWEFHVAARDATGATRVVFSENRTQKSRPDASNRATRTIGCDAFFDISDDGRIVENWTITPLSDPTLIFPRLPGDASQARGGWHARLQLDAAICRYQAAEPAPGLEGAAWQFVEDRQALLEAVYQIWRQRRYAFDNERGLVTSVTSEFRRGWPVAGNSTVTRNMISLAEVESESAVEAKRIGDEADRFFARCAEYQRLIELSLWDLPRATAWLDESGDALQRFEPEIRSEFFRERLRRKLALHREEREGMAADAEKLASLVNRPAAEWRSVGLDGRARASHDYEGQVLVLCFWNRGCAWAIRALAACNGVAAATQGMPVAFLGVSADRNVGDAAFVWQVLDMVFPTVVDVPGADCLAGLFGIDGYPTTVVIDQCGIIRRIRAGYSDRLAATLAAEIGRLLEQSTCASCD